VMGSSANEYRGNSPHQNREKSPMARSREATGGRTQRCQLYKVRDVRSVSRARLTRYRGRVLSSTMNEVEDRLRILIGL
jgi:mRNA-degrading endonuclease toxin of MazEF toxin-antitoxin module